jgi:hypothetical protein
MHVEVVICWERTVDLPGTKSMQAADGTFFTSASAFAVAHLLLKSHLKAVIGCSWKMNLPKPEVQTALLRVCLQATCPANIIQASVVVISFSHNNNSS